MKKKNAIRVLKKKVSKAKKAEQEFNAAFYYCNELRKARGEQPLTMEELDDPNLTTPSTVRASH
jgi:hypothetical protein